MQAKFTAINNALVYREGLSVSDGNMVLGISRTHVAISFNNTPDNQNSLVNLDLASAKVLLTLLSVAVDRAEFLNAENNQQ